MSFGDENKYLKSRLVKAEKEGPGTTEPLDLDEPSAYCPVCWGSHGCDREADHPGNHICGSRDPEGPCSEHTGTAVRFSQLDGRARSETEELERWSEWEPSEAWAGDIRKRYEWGVGR